MQFEDYLIKEVELYREKLIKSTVSLIMDCPSRHSHLTHESVLNALMCMEIEELEDTHNEFSNKHKTANLQSALPIPSEPLKINTPHKDYSNWITKFHGSDEYIESVDFSCSNHFGFHVGTLEQAKIFGNQIHRVEFGYNNLLRMDDLGTWSPAIILNDLQKKHIITSDTVNKIMSEQNDSKKDQMIRRVITEAGFDAIVYNNEVEKKGSKSYIILTSNQIRSITLNNKNSPRMR